jgi:hypothetical protein
MGKAVPRPGVCDEAVFRFFRGTKHGFLVRGQSHIVPGVGLRDLRPDSAEVECRPGDTQPYDVATVRPRKRGFFEFVGCFAANSD